ncbi:sensor histidine kinase [Amycolatopsis sp. NPDC059657]|uniref:sensor histidine kinase n=1 Tax=Amycolatopsis sp. NPDC059657 TaxID=3346899 RepID=UPI0036712622
MRDWWKRRGGLVLDALLWLALSWLLFVDSVHGTSPWEFVFGLVVITAAVAATRRHPVVSLAAATSSGVAMVIDHGGRVPIWPVFVMVAMAYFAGRRMRTAKPALVIFVVVCVLCVPVAYVAGTRGLDGWAMMLSVIGFAALFPWQLGRYVRLRDEMARSGWERAEEIESRQRLVADQARLRERARIAGDMHDSLGHELSLIAVRAAALEVAGGLGEEQSRAAGELRESAAVAMDRLGQIIGVLRENDEPAGHETIPELVERSVASGLAITSTVDDLSAAPAMVERAAYRVVQEALTNVAKHAPGAAAVVTVTGGADETTVSVVNAPPPAGPLPGAASGRHGLVGLRERVRVVGGTFRAEPVNGGFAVEATLPHAGSPGPVEVSDAALGLERARREVRRSLLQAVLVPASLFLGVGAISGIAFLYGWYGSELEPKAYDSFRIGQPRAEIQPFFPSRERVARPYAGEPPIPAGADCVYYGNGRSLFTATYEAYRLCFTDGKLVSKDVLKERSDPRSAG